MEDPQVLSAADLLNGAESDDDFHYEEVKVMR